MATREFNDRLTRIRTRSGDPLYDQFSRRVGYVCDLLKGLDGQGGSKRPIYSLDEVRAIFQVDNVRVTRDGIEYLCAVACTVGLGMLGLAASIFEKAHRSAIRKKRVIDARLLRDAAQRVLIPAGELEDEIMLSIEQTHERVFVSFDYTYDTSREISRFFRKTGCVIIPLTVREILNEQIARKLA